ncbi:Uu.00g063250.m01.CDS01 [Anthostomella pinea]|uniref:Uu.00g063250.m01.CDS01 n=1 Tax=Anthostomella pinea TaxID=933095 RepID=A0AAI8YN07_9PEZI|nr:Uu.00g063250.m01.CDS01 [Anthostomella pinea]
MPSTSSRSRARNLTRAYTASATPSPGYVSLNIPVQYSKLCFRRMDFPVPCCPVAEDLNRQHLQRLIRLILVDRAAVNCYYRGGAPEIDTRDPNFICDGEFFEDDDDDSEE